MAIVTLISHLFPAIKFKTNEFLHYFNLMANKDYKHVAKFLQDLLLCKMSTSVNGMQEFRGSGSKPNFCNAHLFSGPWR